MAVAAGAAAATAAAYSQASASRGDGGGELQPSAAAAAVSVGRASAFGTRDGHRGSVGWRRSHQPWRLRRGLGSPASCRQGPGGPGGGQKGKRPRAALRVGGGRAPGPTGLLVLRGGVLADEGARQGRESGESWRGRRRDPRTPVPQLGDAVPGSGEESLGVDFPPFQVPSSVLQPLSIF